LVRFTVCTGIKRGIYWYGRVSEADLDTLGFDQSLLDCAVRVRTEVLDICQLRAKIIQCLP
jgi:hypothetical protein